MTNYLDRLLDGAHRRVATARQREPLEQLRERAAEISAAPSLRDALTQPGVSVIAEIKRASPSKGLLAPDLDVDDLASEYVSAGAAAISVLTEPDQFLGSLGDLETVAGHGVPTLRKDFILDRYQIWEARAAGASAVLLIVAALDTALLAQLYDEILAAGMTPLVEVHDLAEAQVASGMGAEVIGVNARDLRTFEIDPQAFGRIRPFLGAGVVAVAESGVRIPDDIVGYADQGADAVLVGESLVTAGDPATALRALVDAGRTARREQ
ncbi:MAG: indole-3-glycerol phosphate synthase TrpC [Nitriliruptoraceae bacterium]